MNLFSFVNKKSESGNAAVTMLPVMDKENIRPESDNVAEMDITE